MFLKCWFIYFCIVLVLEVELKAIASIEDMRWALGMGSLKLSPGLLRLFAWTKDFVPTTIRTTKAQTWVRIYHLPLEYWKPRTIFSILRGLGTPLSLDEHTMRKNRGGGY